MTKHCQSGFCIPYSVRETIDKGRGVIADSSVSKDTIIYCNLLDQFKVYDECSLKKHLASLDRQDAIYELTHMFGLPNFPEHVIRFLDDGVLINHSSEPNIALNSHAGDDTKLCKTLPIDKADVEYALLNIRYGLIAISDIKVGDELTMNYQDFTEDPSFYNDLCDQYGVSESYLDWDG